MVGLCVTGRVCCAFLIGFFIDVFLHMLLGIYCIDVFSHMLLGISFIAVFFHIFTC